MGKQPLLSVIVPVYNTSEYLPRCLDSLLKQTYPNIEIILVDDGSTDDSPRICDAYAQNHNNIRVIHKENAGAGFARNSGLDISVGEWVAFCDSDDYIDETMYAKLMAEAEKESVDAVFCDFVHQKHDGVLKSADSVIPAGVYTGSELLLNMLGSPPEAKRDFSFDVSTCKAVYSKTRMDAASVRFPSERTVVSEDLFFHIYFLPVAQKVSYIKETLYYYCQNEASQSHSFVEGRLLREKVFYQNVCDVMADFLQGEEMLRWQRLFLGRIRSTAGQYVYYAKDEPLCKRINAIREIANDELVRSVISNYPIKRNPVKLQVFNLFLKWRFCVGMYILLVLNR